MSNSINPSTPVQVSAKHDSEAGKAVAIEIARLMSDDKCSDIQLLDVRGISQVQDFVIIASGTSDRQMRSTATDIKNHLPKLGSSVYRTSVDDQSTWIVIDCVDTVVHIFEPNTRSYYDLESMWGDAPRLEWLRPGQVEYVAGQDDNIGDSDEPAQPSHAESSEPDAETIADEASTVAEVAEIVEVVKPKKSAAPAKKPAAKAKPAAKKPVAKKAPAAKKPAKAAAKKVAAKAKPAAKKAAPAKKAAAKKPAAKKPTVKKPIAKKSPAKKVPAKKKAR